MVREEDKIKKRLNCQSFINYIFNKFCYSIRMKLTSRQKICDWKSFEIRTMDPSPSISSRSKWLNHQTCDIFIFNQFCFSWPNFHISKNHVQKSKWNLHPGKKDVIGKVLTFAQWILPILPSPQNVHKITSGDVTG